MPRDNSNRSLGTYVLGACANSVGKKVFYFLRIINIKTAVDNMTETKIDIGVLDEKQSWLLHPRFYPSKVGGKPAWLDIQDLPSPTELSCKLCEDPLVFLCQVYAPYEDSDDCFHRTIFLFVCKRGSCCRTNYSGNFVVLRSQLPRKNNFYSFEPYEEVETEIFPLDKCSKLCSVCGARGPSHCSKCKKVYYCSRKHQILDWQKGHKRACSEMKDTDVNSDSFTVTEAGKGLLFKEWEIIVEEEDEEDAKTVDENKELEKLHKMMQDKKAGSLAGISDNELEQYAKAPEDKIFNKFSKRIARHPDQVLRYDRGGTPLWITAKTGENGVMHVPKCEYCNEDRQFEFQIMPQLLNFIDVGVELNSIDWGVLAVYTCKSSCNGPPAYKKEVLIKQDLSQ